VQQKKPAEEEVAPMEQPTNPGLVATFQRAADAISAANAV
jgi:hypothetical protein